jgi:hypothetical protein
VTPPEVPLVFVETCGWIVKLAPVAVETLDCVSKGVAEDTQVSLPPELNAISPLCAESTTICPVENAPTSPDNDCHAVDGVPLVMRN